MKLGRWASLREINKFGLNLPDADAIELRSGKGSPQPPKIIFEMITRTNAEIIPKNQGRKIKEKGGRRKGNPIMKVL